MSSGRRGSSVDPGWRSGRSPATRDRLREWNVPHTAPLCNTNIDFRPTSLESGHLADPEVAHLQAIRGWADPCARRANLQDRLQPRPFARRLAGYRPPHVACVGPRGRHAAALRNSQGKDPPPMLRAASLAALSLLAALVVGCGGGAASGDADPASAVPANALLYAEVAIQPEGDLREDALDAAGKVLQHRGPGGQAPRVPRQGVRRVGRRGSRLRQATSSRGSASARRCG